MLNSEDFRERMRAFLLVWKGFFFVGSMGGVEKESPSIFCLQNRGASEAPTDQPQRADKVNRRKAYWDLTS